jgi:2-polyprenyl-3-methyl-5-hydroxy-6-metoxy-1,4-benzoquinol methylase
MKESTPPYIAKTGTAAKDRLALQHRVFSGGTETLLKMSGFQSKMRILVVGCGCGDETIMIAQKMGSEGEIVAIDVNAEQIEQAMKSAESMGLQDKVKYLNKSVYDLNDEDGNYDLILCRFVIAHLADPKNAVMILRDRLRPSGILAAQEPIVSTCSSQPHSPALERYIGLMMEFGKVSNRDFDMAKQIPSLFQSCGLNIQSQEWQPRVFGPDKRMVTMSAVECAPALEKAGLISQSEAKSLISAIDEEVVKQQDVILFQCINMLVVGQKPQPDAKTEVKLNFS